AVQLRRLVTARRHPPVQPRPRLPRRPRPTRNSSALRQTFEVPSERPGQVGPLQGEIHDGLQEAELIAGVVPDTFDLTGVDRPVLQQPPESVRQLDFTLNLA